MLQQTLGQKMNPEGKRQAEQMSVPGPGPESLGILVGLQNNVSKPHFPRFLKYCTQSPPKSLSDLASHDPSPLFLNGDSRLPASRLD